MNENKFSITKKCGFLGICANIFLMIIKAIVGFTFKSQSMIADCFNSAGDIFASLMTLIGNRISSIPDDENHNFGHGKAEYIFSLFIGISMILVSAKLAYNSIATLFLGNDLQFSYLLLVVSLITFFVKFCLYLYTKKMYKKYNNILLEANMKDHRNDCVVTLFTFLSIYLAKYNLNYFDSIVGISISLWIAYTGLMIFIKSYNILMDISIDTETKNEIINIINKHKEIKNIYNISSSPVGSKFIVFITISLDGNMSTFESHSLANSIEKETEKNNNIYKAFIHVDPI